MPIICNLQDGSEDLAQLESIGSSGVVEINTLSAILFVVIASCFLVMIYKLMSFWFVEVLVVLFCIGGIEVSLHIILSIVDKLLQRSKQGK